MAVPLSFLHTLVTPVGKPAGRINSIGDHRTCSLDYTTQNGHVGLSGGVNGLTGESDHDLLVYHH